MSTLIRKNNGVPVFNNFFDDFFAKDLYTRNANNFAELGNTLPSVNVKENEQNFEIDFAAPGMKKEDFHISLDKNVLTVSSENKVENEQKENNGKFTRREFNYRSFSRSFSIPEEIVDGNNISASYVDGILRIAIPKVEKTTPEIKKIEVQ